MSFLLSRRCRFSLPFSDVTLPDGSDFPGIELASHATETKRALARAFGSEPNLVLVADENTYGAAKNHIGDLPYEKIIFPRGVTPRRAFAMRIKESAKEKSGILAVGGGTINDLCKAAAHEAGKPYVYIPTALSMNGFCSANASIIEANGEKTSVHARPPASIVFVPQIWKDAPSRLWKSGLADAACYASCRFDWLLSHYLTDSRYDETLFTCLRPLLPTSRRDVADLASGKDEALLRFALALCVSGAGMNAAGGSMPASQSEHLICHAFDMAEPRNLLLHGEKVAAASAYAMALQRRLLEEGAPVFDSGRYRRAAFGSFAALRRNSAFRPHLAFMKKTTEDKAALLPKNAQDAAEKIARFRHAFAGTERSEHARILALYASPLFSRSIRKKVLRDPAVTLAAPLLRDRVTILDLCGSRALPSLRAAHFLS